MYWGGCTGFLHYFMKVVNYRNPNDEASYHCWENSSWFCCIIGIDTAELKSLILLEYWHLYLCIKMAYSFENLLVKYSLFFVSVLCLFLRMIYEAFHVFHCSKIVTIKYRLFVVRMLVELIHKTLWVWWFERVDILFC